MSLDEPRSRSPPSHNHTHNHIHNHTHNGNNSPPTHKSHPLPFLPLLPPPPPKRKPHHLLISQTPTSYLSTARLCLLNFLPPDHRLVSRTLPKSGTLKVSHYSLYQDPPAPLRTAFDPDALSRIKHNRRAPRGSGADPDDCTAQIREGVLERWRGQEYECDARKEKSGEKRKRVNGVGDGDEDEDMVTEREKTRLSIANDEEFDFSRKRDNDQNDEAVADEDEDDVMKTDMTDELDLEDGEVVDEKHMRYLEAVNERLSREDDRLKKPAKAGEVAMHEKESETELESKIEGPPSPPWSMASNKSYKTDEDEDEDVDTDIDMEERGRRRGLSPPGASPEMDSGLSRLETWLEADEVDDGDEDQEEQELPKLCVDTRSPPREADVTSANSLGPLQSAPAK